MGEQKYPAKKICTMGNQYYWEDEFEYRGHSYTVYHSSGYTTFAKTPAYLQHLEAQAKIDEMIDGETKEEPTKGTFDADEIFELLGWD